MNSLSLPSRLDEFPCGFDDSALKLPNQKCFRRHFYLLIKAPPPTPPKKKNTIRVPSLCFMSRHHLMKRKNYNNKALTLLLLLPIQFLIHTHTHKSSCVAVINNRVE